MSDVEIDWANMQTNEADDIEWARGEHAASPAPFAQCPECYRFSRYPWQRVYGTQNGTDYVTGGYCAEHGAWSEGSL